MAVERNLNAAMAALTQSRYLFLTDDSGIGNPHAAPAIDCYLVTRLDALLRHLAGLDTPSAGQVELRFTRLKTDGGFMPPKDRVSVYQVRRFEEGWRATSMSALPEGERMTCPE